MNAVWTGGRWGVCHARGVISCLDVRYPELAEALAAIPDSDRAKKVSQVVRVATSRCEIDVSGLSIDQLDRLVEQMDEHA